MTDSITLLTPASSTLAVGKTHRRFSDGTIKTESYGNVRNWFISSHEIEGFEHYATLLEMIASNGRYIVIRGLPKPGVDLEQPHRRLLYDDPETKEAASFDARDSHLCLIDVDNLPNPWGEPQSREEAEALILWFVSEYLPASFGAARCWYQWSSSMGVNGWELLNLHLWFLLETPQSDALMGQWAESNGHIDESVFRAVQPHYLAPPRFVDMEDPLVDWRSGVLIFGERETVDFYYEMVPSDVWQDRKNMAVMQQQKTWKAAGHQFTMVMPGASSAPMQRIAEIGVGGRLHMPITRSAASWVTHCGLYPDREAWKAQVRERVMLSGHRDAAHRSSDLYLNAQWRSALRKYSSKNPDNAAVPRELIVNNNRFD